MVHCNVRYCSCSIFSLIYDAFCVYLHVQGRLHCQYFLNLNVFQLKVDEATSFTKAKGARYVIFLSKM